MLQKASELRMMDVINVADGRRLGNVCDLDMDEVTGQITAVILPAFAGHIVGWNRRSELVITWPQIVRIGQDVILVNLPLSNLSA